MQCRNKVLLSLVSAADIREDFWLARGLAPGSGWGHFCLLVGWWSSEPAWQWGGWGGGPPAVHHLQYVGFPKGLQ